MLTPIPNFEAEQVAPRVPNFDSDPTNYDEDKFVHNRGKIIEGPVNLTNQRNHISSSTYYKEAKDRVVYKGILWDHPPTLLTNSTTPLTVCWLEFFKYRVFNWMPEVMIGQDWKPNCPNCRKKLAKNGDGCIPRLVFDQFENYWLNSPHKYICKSCEDFSKACENENDKKQFNFTALTQEILDQIGMQYPEVLEFLPCTLSKRNAIDKKLMSIITHCAVKGVGPSAMAESIAS